ncbi:MAG: aldo/keto reductase [Propionibacteriales bacterium]|nr:aldo/keto reductase [Propionibacteriales bacterium]
MLQRCVGATGLKVSRLGLGTLSWGTEIDEPEASDQLRAFVDAGGTLVDTAAGYGAGASEELLGRLVHSTVDRDALVIATKAGIDRREGDRRVDVSRRGLLHSLDRSLRRLALDHVDLWQLHAWSDDVPIDETLSALDFAVSSGRARYVGVSNYAGWQTALVATRQLQAPGRARIASTQVEYSLLQRGIEREVAPAAEALGVGLMPWAPLGRGVLSGKYRSGIPSDSRAASSAFERYVGEYLTARSSQIVEAVVRAAEGLELSPVQVALAWVRDQPGVAAPIIGARTTAQLLESLSVEEHTLPDEILDALDDVSAPFVGYPEA